MDELLPCPFCGECRTDSCEIWPGKWICFCQRCRADGPERPTEQAATTAWNTRHFGSPYRHEASNEIGALTEAQANEAGQAVIDNETSLIKRQAEKPA